MSEHEKVTGSDVRRVTWVELINNFAEMANKSRYFVLANKRQCFVIPG